MEEADWAALVSDTELKGKSAWIFGTYSPATTSGALPHFNLK